MRSKKIEETFLTFFKKNGYIEKPEFTLIPRNDESLLFTNSGMVQFKDIFLGNEISDHDKITTSQTCVRVGGKHNDLDNIGKTPHHNTSFKMLGNFCFKNASKLTAINLAWFFLTKKLNLEENKLYITVHKNDREAFEIWKNIICINTDRIILGDDESNFWSMDENGPCGYCSEIFYDIGEKKQNLLEIWNLVFIEFNRINGMLTKLNNLAIDTGMGLERITSIKQNVFDSFKSDILSPLVETILKKFNIEQENQNVRIIADHIKTCILLIKNSLMPSNSGRGYVLKKLIRRAVIKKKELNVKLPLSILVEDFILHIYSDHTISHDDLNMIKNVLYIEEEKFDNALENGKNLINNAIEKHKSLPGKIMFMLYDTYGIPLDLIEDMSKKNNIDLDFDTFNLEMKKQIIRSRKKITNVNFDKNISDIPKTIFLGYINNCINSQVLGILLNNDLYNQFNCGDDGIIITHSTCFYAEKGGQIGDSGYIKKGENTFKVNYTKEVNGIYLHYGKMINGTLKYNDIVEMKINNEHRICTSINHSSTHLLHATLKKVLGNHVQQAGSFINNKYLRFDFIHFKPLSKNELFDIEILINRYIRNNINSEITYSADNNGAKNRIVSFGDNVSKEFCAGTHVNNTGEIGLFKIVKESGIGTNIRRIEAITSNSILTLINEHNEFLNDLCSKLNSDKKGILTKIDRLIENQNVLEKLNEKLMINDVYNELDKTDNLKHIHNITLLSLKRDKKYISIIKDIINNRKNTIIVIFYYEKTNMYISINTTTEINAKDIIDYLKCNIYIKGGGTHNKVNGIIHNSNKSIENILNYLRSYIDKTYK